MILLNGPIIGVSPQIMGTLDVTEIKNKREIQSPGLGAFDANGDSLAFFNSGVQDFQALNHEESLLLVFHAWKAGKLSGLRDVLNKAKSLEQEFSEFLKVHELRVAGDSENSFIILKKLAQKTTSQIIRYRYFAEALSAENFRSLSDEIEKLIPSLPPIRRAALEFNFGVAANNSSNLSIVEEVLGRLAQQRNETANLFFHWLSGMYWAQKSEYEKSLDHYMIALDLAQVIPSRKTDIAFVAYGAIREAFLQGNIERASGAYKILKRAAKEKISTLGSKGMFLCSALMDFIEGRIDSAIRNFHIVYSDETWGFEHLVGSSAYLWALVATGQGESILKAIPRLEKVRDDLSASKDLFSFGVFEIYGKVLISKNTSANSIVELLKYCQSRTHSPQGYHLDWANGILLLLQDKPFEKLKSVIHFKKYPIIQRAVVWLLAREPGLNLPQYWRYIGTQTEDPISSLMCEYRLAQLNCDTAEFVKASLKLYGMGALSWVETFENQGNGLDYKLSEGILGSHFVLDYFAHRVVAVPSIETLDQQPQMAELLLTLAKSATGTDKESIALDLGFNSYDPIQHDPIIYNLLSRLRDWIRRQDPTADIMRGPKGWVLGFFDRIVKVDKSIGSEVRKIVDGSGGGSSPKAVALELERENEQYLNLDIHNPRLLWIIEQIKTRKSLTRSELLVKFPIQKSTAANDFNFLIDKGVISRLGSGRGIHYRLKSIKNYV